MKRNNVSSVQTINTSSRSVQKNFRLNEINEIKIYFNSEFQERKAVSWRLSKENGCFWLYWKTLIDLPATSRGVSIIPFASVTGAPTGIASAIFTLAFSLATGIMKRLLSIARNKQKRNNKTLVIAKSKLNSIKTLISQGLIDMAICHREFKKFVKKKEKHEKMRKKKKKNPTGL